MRAVFQHRVVGVAVGYLGGTLAGGLRTDPHGLVHAELFEKDRTAELQTTSSDLDFVR